MESKLEFTTYSMLVNNIDLNKEKNVSSKYNFLNLEQLSERFNLDITLDDENNPGYINDPPGPPAFVSKSYYQSKPEFVLNYPPKGPIEPGFVCVYCEQTKFHLSNCKRPFDSSLVLTSDGESKYSGKTEGTSYKLIVKKKGQRKVVSESIKSEIFSDNLELMYKNPNLAMTTIRIAKNGSINIISASFFNEDISLQVIKKINDARVLNLEEYQKVYPGKTKISLIPDISYKYIISAQFNLYVKKVPDLNYINLETVNTNLWETNLFKKNINSDTVFMISDKTYYIISKYRYNSGNVISRSNKSTNPFIQFNMIDPKVKGIKISVMIYKRGSVQLKASYNKTVVIDKSIVVLNDAILIKAYNFLKFIISELITNALETAYPVIASELQKTPKGILNMRPDTDGIKRQPQVCHDRAGRLVRPVPYSFYGVCPNPGQYVTPRGLKRPDGRYEPCCTYLTETGFDRAGKPIKIVSTGKSPDTITRYNNILKNGYPDDLFGETIPDPDNLSAVFKPGTKELESRRFKGLKDFKQNELINCIETAGLTGDPDVFQNKKENYNSFKKQVLNKYLELTGTTNLVIQGADSLSIINFNKFSESAHIITPIYNETLNVLLFFDNNGDSFFLNLNSDVSESALPTIPELSFTIIEGYLYPYPTMTFYPIDIIYFKGVDITTKNYFMPGSKNTRFDSLMYCCSKMDSVPGSELTVETVFDLDIVNYSKNYLKENISGLLFIPFDKTYTPRKINKDFLMWSDMRKQSNKLIALNVKLVDDNRWKVSVDEKSIPVNLLPQLGGSVEIAKKFTKDNKINNNDTILFQINFNVTDNLINVQKPLIPIEKIDYKLNDYSDVLNILQSINSPVQKVVFENITNDKYPESVGFNFNGKYYMLIDVNSPLRIYN